MASLSASRNESMKARSREVMACFSPPAVVRYRLCSVYLNNRHAMAASTAAATATEMLPLVPCPSATMDSVEGDHYPPELVERSTAASADPPVVMLTCCERSAHAVSRRIMKVDHRRVDP
jgi:hypothetical protein